MDEQILREIFSEGMPPFREWEEFRTYVLRTYPILIQNARERRLITYSEIANQIGLPFNEWFPLKIGAIVGACSCYEHREGRPLISSIVINGETCRPGNGYWGLPGIPSDLVRRGAIGSVDEGGWTGRHWEFWVNEVNRVFEYWMEMGQI
ncbi:MAG: hypothetical protein ABIK23_07275 [candidate division WOR-3 bacterium]